MCCRVLQGVAGCCSYRNGEANGGSTLQCVAVCCSVLQCAAVCCTYRNVEENGGGCIHGDNGHFDLNSRR